MHSGYGVKPGEHVPGEPMHQYLEDYAKIHGLSDCMTLNTRVAEIERLHNEDDDGAIWRLSCRSKEIPERDNRAILNQFGYGDEKAHPGDWRDRQAKSAENIRRDRIWRSNRRFRSAWA